MKRVRFYSFLITITLFIIAYFIAPTRIKELALLGVITGISICLLVDKYTKNYQVKLIELD